MQIEKLGSGPEHAAPVLKAFVGYDFRVGPCRSLAIYRLYKNNAAGKQVRTPATRTGQNWLLRETASIFLNGVFEMLPGNDFSMWIVHWPGKSQGVRVTKTKRTQPTHTRCSIQSLALGFAFTCIATSSGPVAFHGATLSETNGFRK